LNILKTEYVVVEELEATIAAFLANHTIGRTIVCLSSVTFCILAKRLDLA